MPRYLWPWLPCTLANHCMEEEFQAICSQLVKSIRRESDLDVLVNELQGRIAALEARLEGLRRRSTDSGYSSPTLAAREHHNDDADQRSKFHESQITTLEPGKERKIIGCRPDCRPDCAGSEGTLAEATCYTSELQAACNELRRHLSQERETNSNLENLVSGLNASMKQICRERDSLREMLIRKQMPGSTYEASLQRETAPHASANPPGPVCLTDTQGGSQTHQQQLRDVRNQRDALHGALKNLLQRQDVQTRECRRNSAARCWAPKG